jgi:hypothetical protein
MRKIHFIAGAVAGLLLGLGVALAAEPQAKQAREAIAGLVGKDVRIRSVSAGLLGGDAVVTAQVELAFLLHEQDGTWKVAAVRLGDSGWEDVGMIQRALDGVKRSKAADELRALDLAIAAYRADRGSLPDAVDAAGLVDRLAPRYLKVVIREDPWHTPYYYRSSGAAYTLGSAGPDRVLYTGDDVLLTGGHAQ